MATQPMFDDPFSKFEYAARTQMDLTDDWRLVSSATAVRAGLEQELDRLDADKELDADEKWACIDMDNAPLAWLPEGLVLVTMRREVKGKVETKSGFVKVQ